MKNVSKRLSMRFWKTVPFLAARFFSSRNTAFSSLLYEQLFRVIITIGNLVIASVKTNKNLQMPFRTIRFRGGSSLKMYLSDLFTPCFATDRVILYTF